MKKKYQVVVTAVARATVKVDAVDEEQARLQASIQLHRAPDAHFDIFPSAMGDYLITEVPLSEDEIQERQRVAQAIAQAQGPLIPDGTWRFRAVSDHPDSDWIELETGRRMVLFDGGRMWAEDAESERQRMVEMYEAS